MTLRGCVWYALTNLRTSESYDSLEYSTSSRYVSVPSASKRAAMLWVCRDVGLWRIWGDNIPGKAQAPLEKYSTNGMQWCENGNSKRYLALNPPPLQRVKMVRSVLARRILSHSRSSSTWPGVFNIFIIVA